ncbi:MAG: GAF domain-containing protein [Myxococcota bacterium]
MRRRIGIHGATDEALALIPLLSANPAVEIVHVQTEDVEAVVSRFPYLEPGVAALLEQVLTDDPDALVRDTSLHAVIDASPGGRFGEIHPEVAARGVQVVPPLTARLLWGYGTAPTDHKADLLKALHEVVEGYELTVDTDELFTRMLEIALGVTGAEGGSLMLLDEPRRELFVRVAVGVEPELWPKIRVALGEGIAGRVAQEGRPLRLRGKADRQRFHILRERMDVESALCVPLFHEGRVLGVLNLHHGSRPDAFGEADLEFTEELARLDAQIIARAQEHDALRSQAARYQAVREVQTIMDGKATLGDRLGQLCRFVAREAGGGIATIYLHDPDEDALRFAATSLSGGNLGSEVRIGIGVGIDGVVAQTGEPIFLPGAAGRLAYAAVPLLAGDALVGVLSLQMGSEDPAPHLSESLLVEIAGDAGAEIGKADREARMTGRATKISAINEAGIRMISTQDPSEVLRQGTSAAAMVLEADHAVLRLQDPETRRFVIRSYFGSADGTLQEKLFRMDRHVSVDVLKRRAPLLVRDVQADPMLRAFETDVRSLVAAPLQREGRLVGTLALYDKIAADRFYPGRFANEDRDLFSKFATYLERALDSARAHEKSRQQQSFDDATGLANARLFGARVQEELARAGNRDGALALAVARIDNLADIARGDAEKADRAVMRVVEALRARSRGFDVLGRLAEDEFAVLLPEPGAAPSERVTELARTVADDVSKDEELNDPVRVSLAFGYASVPEDGTERDALLVRAREPRIHMV